MQNVIVRCSFTIPVHGTKSAEPEKKRPDQKN